MKRFIGVLISAVSFVLLFGGFSACKKKSESDLKYEITAEYVPETATLTATEKVEFLNTTGQELAELKFNLFPNAYREKATYKPVSPVYSASAYYGGKNYGCMEISDVVGAKSFVIEGEDENILSVELEAPLGENERVTLDIAFLTKLAKINHRTGVTKETVNLGNFFPILCVFENGEFYECVYYSDGDPFYSECADYSVSLTVPKEYTAASTGKELDVRSLGSKKEYTLAQERARDFAVVLSDSFEVESGKCGNVEVRYYYYKDENPAESLAVALGALSFDAEQFGAYPYENYSVVQTGFCFGGMEYPALSMISDTLKTQDRISAIVHETAHQWWYAAVGSDQLQNAWQDEGLAEYSTVLFFEKKPEYGLTREEMIGANLTEYRSYYHVYSEVFGEADTRMTRSLKEYISEYEYRCIAYDKGSILFDTLRTSLGDKKFFAALKRYYAEFKFKRATKEDLISCFEKSGVDVKGFFESFLDGKAVL